MPPGNPVAMSKIRTSPAASRAASPDTPERVTFLIVPRFNMATLITLIEPLRVANYLSPTLLYEWEILSLDGVDIPASNGLSMAAAPPPTATAGAKRCSCWPVGGPKPIRTR